MVPLALLLLCSATIRSVDAGAAFVNQPVRRRHEPAAVGPLFVSLSTWPPGWESPYERSDGDGASAFSSKQQPANATTMAYNNDNQQRLIFPSFFETEPVHSVAATHEQPFKVFCDLDGVLVDFEHGVRKLFPDTFRDDDAATQPIQIQDLHRSTMWRRVASSGAFFEQLPWTHDGPQLWQAIQHLRPDILTGVPTYQASRGEKFSWCQRELGVDVTHVDMAGQFRHHAPVSGQRSSNGVCNVITCWSDKKHHESGPNTILIDDREQLRDAWEAAGGIFVHHRTGNVDATLQQLRDIGAIGRLDQPRP